MSNDDDNHESTSAKEEEVEERTRTVLDFTSGVDLKEALSAAFEGKQPEVVLRDSASKKINALQMGCFGEERCSPTTVSKIHDTAFDWVLTNYDETTTEAQSMEEELHRLLVLKSYLLLDSDREEAFERLTGLGSRIFDVPICLVSLVDLGRQWFMSNKGLGLCRQTNRRVAFCAHAIQLKPGLKTLVVTDARDDFRFRDSPLVLGAPFIRFYAGAPLISPEGYKLGTFCIISPEPRPQGLSEEEQESLIDMANITVKTMVDRRQQLESREDPARLIAYTSHDLMTPLSGVQLALSLLSEDDEVLSKLDPHQNELLSTAANCSDVMIRICKSSIESLRSISSNSKRSLFDKENGGGKEKITKILELVKSLQVIVEPIPKQAPLVITLSPNVPHRFFSDDLKIFRSVLNLVKDAILRTEVGKVHLRVFKEEQDASEVVDDAETRQYLRFECEDTGIDIPASEVPFLFEPNSDTPQTRLGLHSIANLITSLHGTFGYQKRGENVHGSIFWFSVPLIAANAQEDESAHSFSFSMNSTSNLLHFQRKGTANPGETTGIARCPSTGSLNSLSSQEDEVVNRTRRALIIDDSVIVRKTIDRALTKLGFEVEQAEDGSVGLNAMKKTMFDIVLCDFLMPVMDGLDCVKQYRDWEKGHRPSFRQYIVGISAHVGVEESGQGLEAGMNVFRPKPVTMKNLTELQKSKSVQRIMKELDRMELNSASKRQLFACSVADECAILSSSPPPEIMALQRRVEKIAVTTRVENRFALVLSEESNPCFDKMIADGWQVVMSQTSADFEGHLRKRNWDLVLVDEEIPFVSAPRLIAEFREWEAANRVNEQKNVFFVSGSDIPRPSDKNSIVRPPLGFNGVLRKPIEWEDVDQLLNRNKNFLNILVPK